MATGSFKILRHATFTCSPSLLTRTRGQKRLLSSDKQGKAWFLPDGRPVCSGMASPASTQLQSIQVHTVCSQQCHIPAGTMQGCGTCVQYQPSPRSTLTSSTCCAQKTILRAPEHYAKLRHLLCAPVSTSTWCMDHVRQSGSPQSGKRTKPALLNWSRCRRWEALFLI